MESSDEIRRLLEEIRDTQREHLAEYRKAAERSVALQEEATERQRQHVALYKRVALVGGIVIGAIILLILYLLDSISPYL